MTTHKILLSAVAALLLVARLASAQATFTLATGTQQPVTMANPSAMVNPGGVVDPGDVQCQQAQYTGNPLAPCPPGVSGTVRGQQIVVQDITNDPRASGVNYVTVNGNIRSDGTMAIWGTFRMEALAGGTWEGTWNGKQDLLKQTKEITRVGHGNGGAVDGLHFRSNDVYPPGSNVGNISIVIMLK